MAQTFTVTLSDRGARRVRELISRGDFADESEIFESAIDQFDGELEVAPEAVDELREEILAALNDPRPRLTTEQVRERLLAHHEATMKRHGTGR